MPDAWDQTALITINDGTTDLDIAAMTETIDIDLGDRDGEGIPNLKGGRIWKNNYEADTSITFEGYPISIGDTDDTSPDGLMAFFFGGSGTDVPLSATDALQGNTDADRQTFTVYIMWTDDTSVSAATSTVSSGGYGLRYKFENCYFVSCKPSYTDGILSATWTFKCPPRQKDATANITVQSTDNTATMPSA